MPRYRAKTCVRCGSELNLDGKCADPDCPFSDHLQTCPAGWRGHPEHSSGECDCITVYHVEVKVTLHVHTNLPVPSLKNVVTMAAINALQRAERDGMGGDEVAISVEDAEIIEIGEL